MAYPAKSPLLQRQIRDTLGNGPVDEAMLAKLLGLVDATYGRLASLQKATIEFGRVVSCEWNFASGLIEGGRAWKTLLGYAQDELDERIATWRTLADGDDLKALFAAVEQHGKAGNAPFRCDCRFRGKGGEWRWLRIAGRITERLDNGLPRRAVVAVQDIDAAKRGEAALQSAKDVAELASRSRSAFLANMSHEIRTPMNAVLGMTELVLGTNLDAEQQHYLAIVKSSAEALLTIIDDILDFSKIEAGKLEFELVDFAPRNLVFDAARAMALQAQDKGLEVLVNLDPALPGRLVGDPTRLRQVLTNLLSNAVKFTEKGEVAIEVGLDSIGPDFAILRFTVRDSGIGIPLDKQRDIFEAFAQADPSITRRFGGTGLGLAICRRLVDLMGGRVWLESEPGQGSLFHFTARLGIEAAAPVAAAAGRFAGRRVLLAMGNRNARANLADMLQRLGFLVTQADSREAAAEAMALLRNGAAEAGLLVADAPLLLADDAALLARWQARDASSAPAAALLTLPTQPADSARLRELGVTCHLIKPVAEEDLADALSLAFGMSTEPAFELAAFTVEDELSATHSDQKPMAILLVEDNPVNQELAQRLLEKAGHKVAVANHGEEALALFDRQHFDVILMDMQMPVMGGIEATEAIRAREMRRSWIFSADRTNTAYIIALTANAMAGDRERCLQAGMNDYVAKPIRQADLYAALARAATALGRGSPSLAEMAYAAAVPAAASGTTLDIDAAEQDLGDRSLVLDLARALLDQWDGTVTSLDAALAERNAEALERHAHTIKGFLAMFHAEGGRSLALAVEQAAKRQEWSAAAAQLADLKAELGKIKPLLANAVR